MKLRALSVHLLTALAVLLLMGATAQRAAADFTVVLDTTFSGGSPAAGDTLTAKFQDVSGGVLLTLQTNLSGSELVSEWDLNFNPNLDVTKLNFNLQSGGTGPTGVTPSLGADSFKADGTGGFFDIGFNFPTSNSVDRFDGSETLTYKITSTQSISAADFNFQSSGSTGAGTNGVDKGGWTSAAHIQSIAGAQDSGWIGNGSTNVVPAPPTAVLMGLGGIALGIGAAIQRRRRQLVVA